MADRIIKPDSGNDVVIQNNGGTRKIEVTNSGDVEVTGDVKTTTVKATNLKANDGTASISIADSNGNITLSGNLVIPDNGNIGSSSDTDAITIASNGNTTLGGNLVIQDNGTIGSASDTDAITIGSNGNTTLGGNLVIPDNGTIGSASDTDAIKIDSNGNLLVGTASASSSARLNVRRESLTSNTKATNTIAKLGAGTGTNRDAHIILSDYAAYDYYFGGRAGTAYVTVNNNNGVKLGSGNTSWSSDSDESLKDIIEPITNAVATVQQWRTVFGKYKTDEEDKRRVFFIAQDFQESLPEAVDESPEGTLLLHYQDAIPVLSAAIKELKAELDTVKEELDTLKG